MNDEKWEKLESDGTCQGCHFHQVQYDWVYKTAEKSCGLPDDFPDCEHKIVFVRK